MFKQVTVTAVALVLAAAIGCKSEPKTADDRATLRSQSDALITTSQANHPLVKEYMKTSEAYAVFPSIGEGGFLVAGGYGKGTFYEKGKLAGYCDASMLSIGATIGGQSYSEIIFFETSFAAEQFKSGKFTLDAKASAVAMAAGATAQAKYTNGVAVIVMDQSGLLAQASIGGQNFRFTPLSK